MRRAALCVCLAGSVRVLWCAVLRVCPCVGSVFAVSLSDSSYSGDAVTSTKFAQYVKACCSFVPVAAAGAKQMRHGATEILVPIRPVLRWARAWLHFQQLLAHVELRAHVKRRGRPLQRYVQSAEAPRCARHGLLRSLRCVRQSVVACRKRTRAVQDCLPLRVRRRQKMDSHARGHWR